jgi:hypothetical protein
MVACWNTPGQSRIKREKRSAGHGHDLLSGSFSSKSEGALALSTRGRAVTFMGYAVPANVLDASNGNTPGVIDPTNPDAQQVFRGVAELDGGGKFWFTETNAYSGDNGRAAILDDTTTGHYFAAGNSNNGDGTSPSGLIFGTGAQLVTPAREAEAGFHDHGESGGLPALLIPHDHENRARQTTYILSIIRGMLSIGGTS